MGVLICRECGAKNTFHDSLCTCGRHLALDRPLTYQRGRRPPWGAVCLLIAIEIFGVLGYVINEDASTYYGHAQRAQAQLDADVIDDIAAKWAIDRVADVCPSPEELRDLGELSVGSKLTDPWETPYVTECTGAVIEARSAGPDRKLHTRDDIISRRNLESASLP